MHMGFGKKSSPAPTPAPAPVVTPIQQTPQEPINRAATNAEARDRVDKNGAASLLATDMGQDTTTGANLPKAGLMG